MLISNNNENPIKINIGEKAQFSKTINESDISLFSGLVADFHPMHVNAIYAAKSKKGNRTAHSAILIGLANGVLRNQLPGKNFQILDFSPFGYDERQFCSPGFNLPFGCLMRTPNGKYPEYHTSGDNLDFIKAENLGESLSNCTDIIELLECNNTYQSTNPKCEPQLGKRNLFKSAGRKHQPPEEQFALLWVLNLSDGIHSLLDIAQKSGINFESVRRAAVKLLDCGLLREDLERGH